jgi:hypothetical protein
MFAKVTASEAGGISAILFVVFSGHQQCEISF